MCFGGGIQMSWLNLMRRLAPDQLPVFPVESQYGGEFVIVGIPQFDGSKFTVSVFSFNRARVENFIGSRVEAVSFCGAYYRYGPRAVFRYHSGRLVYVDSEVPVEIPYEAPV